MNRVDVPTMVEIRERHSNFVTAAGGVVERVQQRNAEFDRWLAVHDAAVAAETRRECAALPFAVENRVVGGIVARFRDRDDAERMVEEYLDLRLVAEVSDT